MCCQGKKVSRFSIFLENRFSDEEVKKRLEQFYGQKKGAVGLEQLPFVLEKLGSLSEFVREIKVNFTLFYYKRHGPSQNNLLAKLGVGPFFQVLDIPQYACGLKFGSAFILDQNLYFEMPCRLLLRLAYEEMMFF